MDSVTACEWWRQRTGATTEAFIAGLLRLQRGCPSRSCPGVPRLRAAAALTLGTASGPIGWSRADEGSRSTSLGQPGPAREGDLFDVMAHWRGGKAAGKGRDAVTAS